MLAVKGILESPGSDTEEYYRILGCDENSSEDQINAEYKLLALKCHPDKNCGSESALAEFQKLQEARDTLTDPEKRRQYDKWRRSEVSVPFKQWLGLINRCQPTMHWAKPKDQIMLEDPNRDQWKTSPELAGRFGQSDSSGLSDIKWESSRTSSWEPDNGSGVYKQFRNYKI